MYLQVLNYPIVGNTESFEAMYLYLHIIINAVKIGRSKERLKILNLKIKNQKSYNVL